MSTQKGNQQGGRFNGKPTNNNNNNGGKSNNQNQQKQPQQQPPQQPQQQPQQQQPKQQQSQQPQPKQQSKQPEVTQQPTPQPAKQQQQQQPNPETPSTTSTAISFCPLLLPGTFSTVKTTTVTTNIFSTTLDPKLLSAVYQYSVAFDPPIPSAHQKRKQFYNFALLRPSSALEWLAYDGEGLCYSFLPYDNITLSYNDLITEVLKTRDIYDEFGTKVTSILGKDQKVTITMTNKCHLGTALQEFKKTTSTHQAIVDAFGSINNHNQHQLASSDTLRLKNELVSFVNLSLSTLLRHCSVAFACHSERNRIRKLITDTQKIPSDVVAKSIVLLSIEGFIARNGVVYRLDRPDSYKNPLGNGLYGIHSSFSALRFLQKGMSFVVDLSSTPCYKLGESIITILKEILGSDRSGTPLDLKSAPQSIYGQLSKYRAITTHLPPGKNQRVALHKVGAKLKDCSFIDNDTGKTIKVGDYFKKQYNITCNPEYYTYVVEKIYKPKMDPKTNKPLPKQPAAGTIIQHHFPIEVLSLYSMNNNGAKDLNVMQTKSMLDLMTQRPHVSLQTIQEQLKLLQTAITYMGQQTAGSAGLVLDKNDQDYTTASKKSIYNGIVIATTPQTAKARVLPAPSAQFGGNVVVVGQAGEFKVPPKHTFVQPASANGTVKVVLAILTRFTETDATNYANAVISIAGQRGLKLELDTSEPTFDIQKRRQPKDLELWCEQIFKKSSPTKPYLVLALCQSNSPLYDLLKRKCDFHLGLITQCADASKVSKNLRQEHSTASYVGNIILKINSKLGGLNYLLKSQQPQHNPLLSNAVQTASTTSLHETLSKTVPIACFGIDVFHNPSKRSHAGVVCSYNQQLTQYNGYLIQQPKTAKDGKEQKAQEMIGTTTLQKAFCELLLQFAKCQTKPSLPNHLVIYRDGLSESQMSISMDVEIPGIIAAAQEAYLSLFPTSTYQYNPTITFLIAVKRHHVILVPNAGEDDPIGNKGARTENVRAGTVIDTDIVRQDVPEFFLQAHQSALGTGKSTCYQVVYCSDAQRVSMDDIQLLTNYLSYNHQRAYKATRIPSTVAFADLLCYRGRLFQRESAHNLDGSWEKEALPPNMMKKHFWL